MRAAQYIPTTDVLLIEDNPSDAELVRAYLESSDTQNFHVVHASSMTTAIPLMAEMHPHLVMLDLALPDALHLDGLANIQAMNPNLPVLILTGRNDEDLASMAVARGAQDYLLKQQINPHMLRRSINHAIQRKKHEDAITYQAHFDRLTGLANRELFRERLDVALSRQRRTHKKLGVMLIDLDGFKTVNDTHGHDAGDRVLQEIGQRIPKFLRTHDVAARLGGDEFVILIEDIESELDCAIIAQKLLENIAAPVALGNQTYVTIGLSIGITLCDPFENSTSDALLRQADEAMYDSKHPHRNGYEFYRDMNFIVNGNVIKPKK